MSEENTNATPQNSPEKKSPVKTTEKPNSKSPRITNSQKEKDPRKVAAGKKLGAISKMAKSQKKYKAEAHNTSEREAESTKISSLYPALTVCVVVGVVGLVYFKTKKTEENNDPPKNQNQNQRPNPNLISLD